MGSTPAGVFEACSKNGTCSSSKSKQRPPNGQDNYGQKMGSGLGCCDFEALIRAKKKSGDRAVIAFLWNKKGEWPL
jgi:hypothetical protein